MRKILVCGICMLLSLPALIAQAPKKLSSTEVYHSLQKLNFLGTALYVAAHPDDENTRLIAYLSNEVKARTGYLSLTRGDGGQNLIGPELRESLGVLRTQELLAARRVDGGEQFFSRANDFGFSKQPKETLKIWDKDDVLGDVVWVIRNFKPDVIINRFDHRTPGTTHGHHTASAMLAMEAFDLVNDPEVYSEQLKLVQTWQPRRMFFNTSWWFYGSRENFEKADKSNMLSVDTGVYYAMKGISNNEIAAMASSQHLCQGFGRLTTRGSQQEYIELLKGDMPVNGDIFEGIDTSWSRVKGGDAIGEILYEVENNFDFKNPANHLPQLAEAYVKLQKIDDEHWKTLKSKELKDIITAITGLYLEASAEVPYSNPGSQLKINIEALNRSSSEVVLKEVSIKPGTSIGLANTALNENQKVTSEMILDIPQDQSYTSPYWLSEKWSLGMYKVDQQSLIGKPETPRAFKANFRLSFGEHEISFERPIVHRYSRPDKGELYRPFEVLPEATVRVDDKVMIFADDAPKQIPVTVKAHKDGLKGNVRLSYSEGWSLDQESLPFEIAKKGDEKTLIFTLNPPSNEDEGYIKPILTINGNEYSKELVVISYDHIPTQSVLLPSEAKVVRLDLQKAGEHIGYIMGAGDQVPKSLEQIGYTVHMIDPADIQPGTLDKYDAIVVGIRAYNVNSTIKFKQQFLFDYVENGGNLVIQYNTAGRWAAAYEEIAPYPLKLSRDRVTEENSDVKILAKDHALVNFPNTITEKDFNGWVQERGLYFPNEWDPAFTPILSMSDEGESAKEGSLLVAPHGKGNYIYTGLSFFRELPAGVPGAYKLFSNMLSLGKEKLEKESAIKG